MADLNNSEDVSGLTPNQVDAPVELSSHGKARFAIRFSNGVRLSFIWASLTYSDNHDEDWLPAFAVTPELEALGMHAEPQSIKSSTVEIMAFGPDEYTEFFETKYGNNPAGYVRVTEIPSIMIEAQNWKPGDAKL